MQIKGFRALYVLIKMLLQHFCNSEWKKREKGMVASGRIVRKEVAMSVFASDYVVLDVETNGLSSLRDDLLSIRMAVLCLKNVVPNDNHSCLGLQ